MCAALLAALFLGCGNGGNPAAPYGKTGKEALLIVIENNNLLDSEMEAAYQVYHEQLKSIFADLFEVNISDISDDMTLVEVVDSFGEAWQIRKLEASAQPYYSRIIALTDAAATGRAALDSLLTLQREGCVIDMIFNLHGGSDWFSSDNYLCFADRNYFIAAFTDSLVSRSIVPRALYQTCCWGADMIDDWEKTGITAVNGSSGANTFAMFSPLYFLDNWTKGMTYADAVSGAFNAEIKKIGTYRSKLAAISLLLTPEVIASSAQKVGGSDSLLLWDSAR